MFLLKLLSSGVVGPFLKKFLPWFLGIGAIVGVLYFGYHYLENMKSEVEATKADLVAVKAQNEQIKAANAAIAEDMKGVKELTDSFNTQLTTIRANSSVLTNVVSSPKFKTTVSTDVKASQEQLNKSFNDYFTKLNGVTHGQ